MIENFGSVSSLMIGMGILIVLVSTIILIKSIFDASKMRKTHSEIKETIDQQLNNITNLKNTDSFQSITTTQTIKKTIYENGEKISEVETTTHNNIDPVTNCPNCGAKIIDRSKTNCDYCHTSLQ